jgi:1-acyl-sn-glycerol-3-phosphate acyltransferase
MHMLRRFLRTIYGVYAVAAFIVVVLLMFCPVLIIAPTLGTRRVIGRATVRSWLAVMFVPFRVKGLEHLPKTPCVVVCNHASYVDGIVLTAALPETFTFLVQHETETWPYVGLIVRRMGSLFVNRGAVMPAALAVRRLIREVESGSSTAIFPEGSFRKAPGLMRFYEGAFVVAAKAGVPVVPAVMRGSRRLLSDGQVLPQISAIDIEFFAPIFPTGTHRSNTTLLCAEARQVMLMHCAEGDAIATPQSVVASTEIEQNADVLLPIAYE